MTLRFNLFFPALLFTISIFSCTGNVEKKSQKEVTDYRALKLELDNMYDRDQEIRRLLIDSIGFDSPEAGKYIAKMLEIDSINQVRIIEILDQYNWLPLSKVGEKANSAIFVVVQHSNLELMEKYFPQLKALAEEGEASAIDAAMMEDRILMHQGRKQKFGTQASSMLRADGSSAIWPIENPDSVNFLRASVGFDQTVEENAKRLEAEYNPEEELPSNN